MVRMDASPAAIEKAMKRLERAKRRLAAIGEDPTRGQRRLNEKQLMAMACVAAQGQRYRKEIRTVFDTAQRRPAPKEVIIIRTIFDDEIQIQCHQLVKRRLMYIERTKDNPNQGRHVLTALGQAVLERDQARLT